MIADKAVLVTGATGRQGSGVVRHTRVLFIEAEHAMRSGAKGRSF